MRFSPLLCHLYNTVSSSTPPSVSCFPFIYFSVILLPHPDVFPISVFSFRWGNPYIAMGKTPGQWAILLAFLVRGARGGFEASCKMDWMHLFKGFPLDTCLDWRNGFAIHGNESRRKMAFGFVQANGPSREFVWITSRCWAGSEARETIPYRFLLARLSPFTPFSGAVFCVCSLMHFDWWLSISVARYNVAVFFSSFNSQLL